MQQVGPGEPAVGSPDLGAVLGIRVEKEDLAADGVDPVLVEAVQVGTDSEQRTGGRAGFRCDPKLHAIDSVGGWEEGSIPGDDELLRRIVVAEGFEVSERSQGVRSFRSTVGGPHLLPEGDILDVEEGPISSRLHLPDLGAGICEVRNTPGSQRRAVGSPDLDSVLVAGDEDQAAIIQADGDAGRVVERRNGNLAGAASGAISLPELDRRSGRLIPEEHPVTCTLQILEPVGRLEPRQQMVTPGDAIGDVELDDVGSGDCRKDEVPVEHRRGTRLGQPGERQGSGIDVDDDGHEHRGISGGDQQRGGRSEEGLLGAGEVEAVCGLTENCVVALARAGTVVGHQPSTLGSPLGRPELPAEAGSGRGEVGGGRGGSEEYRRGVSRAADRANIGDHGSQLRQHRHGATRRKKRHQEQG